MINLRPYQHESIKQLREGFKSARRQVLCLPTGAGKTVVFSEMARLAASKGTQTLVLTDRLELFDQTFKSLSRVGIICQRIEAKGNKRFDTRAMVSVGMVETVKRRFAKGIMEGFEPKLIVIDEAHKGNFNAILEAWPNAMVIGATATPVGKHFYKYYSSIVQNIDIPELIEQGFLMPCKPYHMHDDLSDLKTVAGEYTDDSLYSHFNSQRLFDGVISEWQKLAKGKKTLVFNVNIQHANNMTKAFNDAGIFSECVTSETSKEDRSRILRAFSMGLIPVLNNCGILTTGYDEPSIECIIMNRATKSLPLWLQCCGRGSRLCDEIGKEEFIVLDFGLNHNEHGMWSEARKWQIAPPKKKKKMEAAPVKECPKCNALVFASARTCRYCEHVFPFEAKELSQGSMVAIGASIPVQLEGRRISSLDLDELIILEHSKAYKASFIWRVIRSKGKETIREYAAKKKHSSGWAWRQEKDINNSSFKDYILK